jgi:hypothetical protein
MNENNILSNIPQTLTTMQTQDKGLPFQIIHRFIALVRLTHRSESARKSSNIMFSDDELVIISHLEQAATDLRCANPEIISQAKKILSESPFVPKVSNYKRHLLACIELLLIEAKARQKNPALYDFLYQGTLWYYHNHSELPKEVVGEIAEYLAYGNLYESPEKAQKADEYLEQVIAYLEKRPSSVEAFIREKYHQMPDYERNDFLSSKSVKNWTAKWHAEYCRVKKHVSIRTFQTRVSELRKELKKEVVN